MLGKNWALIQIPLIFKQNILSKTVFLMLVRQKEVENEVLTHPFDKTEVLSFTDILSFIISNYLIKNEGFRLVNKPSFLLFLFKLYF